MSAAHHVWLDEDELEDLSVVRRRPQRHVGGPVVSWDALSHLCGLTQSPITQGARPQGSDQEDEATSIAMSDVDRAQLVPSGWLSTARGLGERGQELAAGLGTARTVLSLRAWHRGELRRGWVVVGDEVAVTAYEEDAATSEQAPPGVVTFDVTPVDALPIVLAKWGGLAPTWNYDTAHEVGDAALVQRRVHDMGTPAPPGGDAELARLWQEDWTLWAVQDEASGIDLEFLAIGEQGQYVLRERTDGATVLAPRPGSLLWGDLQLVLATLSGGSQDGDDGEDW